MSSFIQLTHSPSDRAFHKKAVTMALRPRTPAQLVALTALLGAVVGVSAWMLMTHTATKEITVSAEYPSYASLADAQEASDAIVVARVLDSHVELLEPRQVKSSRGGVRGVATSIDSGARVVATMYTVEVSTVINGDTVRGGDTMTVSQIGGTYKGVTYIDPQGVALSELGESLVLLLEDTGEGMYTPIHPDIGVFEQRAGLLIPVTDRVAPEFRGLTVDYLSWAATE